jgi:type VI protein secretion system component Hcp
MATTHLDSSSPVLFQKVCEGGGAPNAFFTLTDRGTGLAFYKIHFTEVLITSVQPASSPGGNSALEQLTFNFTAIQVSAADQQGNTSTISCQINTGTSNGGTTMSHPTDQNQRR